MSPMTLIPKAPRRAIHGNPGHRAPPCRQEQFTQLFGSSVDHPTCKMENPESAPTPGRYPFKITDRLAVLVVEREDGVVLFSQFFDGKLLTTNDEPLGEA